MYRYCVDNAVTYTSEDFVLFRESPFACWMERLTLENPDHGIASDADTTPPRDRAQPQDALADVLRAENKHLELIEWEAEEPHRRTATLSAMRRGVDFIVNGQLAVGPLSGPANLLMRTSGYSELGNYLYVPCDTQAKTTLYSAFRLCFLADLLHSLQGQLPPQMLLIRGGPDLLPLRTEDHFFHYMAVKQRFMRAMAEFRKHRMPDPAESAHFGRWSDCANEVLRKRALRAVAGEDEELLEGGEEEAALLPDLAALNALAAARVSARLLTPGSSFDSGSSASGETQTPRAFGMAPRSAGTARRDEPEAGVNGIGEEAPVTEGPAENTIVASAPWEMPGEVPVDAEYLKRLDFIGSQDRDRQRLHPLDSRDFRTDEARPEGSPPSPGPQLRADVKDPAPGVERESVSINVSRPFSSSLITGPLEPEDGQE